MNNSDLPANPTSPNGSDPEWAAAVTGGLTKREHFCLEMGVPETGDPELDEIISKGNRIKLAGLAMQGLLSNPVTGDSELHSTAGDWRDNIAEASLEFADSLVSKLNKVQQ